MFPEVTIRGLRASVTPVFADTCTGELHPPPKVARDMNTRDPPPAICSD